MSRLKWREMAKKATNRLKSFKLELSSEKRKIDPEKQRRLNEMLLDEIIYGSNHKIKRLIHAGADVNAKSNEKHYEGMTYLMNAICYRNHEKEKMILTRPGTEEWSTGPITFRKVSDNIKTVRIMINAGADVNERDARGWTSLMWAAATTYSINIKEIAAILIERGADVNARGNSGETALMITAKEGNKEITKILIAKGADVNAKDHFGNTALMEAVRWNHMGMAKMLIYACTEIDSNSMRCALAEAIKHNDEKMVDHIVSYLVSRLAGKQSAEEFLSNFDECTR